MYMHHKSLLKQLLNNAIWIESFNIPMMNSKLHCIAVLLQINSIHAVKLWLIKKDARTKVL